MLMRISVKRMDHLGRGIGYNEGKVIFIPKAIPGDVVDIEITNSYKKYDIGKIIEIIEPSNERIDVGCPYYYECGGCHISNLKYFNQVNFKKDKVIDIFKRYLNKEIVPRVSSSEKDFEYRNKITYQVRNGKIGEVYNLGGHSERTNLEVVKTILKQLGKDESLIEYVTDRPGHDLRYAIDSTKVERELGWNRTYTFENGIEETINWYVDNQKWIDDIKSGEYKKSYVKKP